MPNSPVSTGRIPRDAGFHALIPCAGSGSRLPGDVPKQYRRLLGRCVVRHTVDAFVRVPRVASVSVVVQPGDAVAAVCLESTPRLRIIERGGPTRAHSVIGGLEALLAGGAAAHDWVLVHDAARCCITPTLIDALIEACAGDPVGGLLALPLPDTLKAAGDDRRVARTEPRDGRWLAQTPQMFRIGALLEALRAAVAAQAPPTDESGAIERTGARPLLVPGAAWNFKITYPDDLELAQALLAQRRAAQGERQ